MSSTTEICNLALANIGAASIADIDESSTEARQCRIHFVITRDTLLQGYPWLFARKMQALAPTSSAWSERWTYTYARPSDCLKPIRIVPTVDHAMDTRNIPFDVGGGTIFCCETPAKLEYTTRIEDPSLFPPLFQDALAFALATRISMSLTKDASIRKDAFQLATRALGAAQMADANETPGTYDYPSAFIEARA